MVNANEKTRKSLTKGLGLCLNVPCTIFRKDHKLNRKEVIKK